MQPLCQWDQPAGTKFTEGRHNSLVNNILRRQNSPVNNVRGILLSGE